MATKLRVVISLDVEEEGLFSGQYPSLNPGVKNVARIGALDEMSRELAFPLTLFCSHAVFDSPAALESVGKLVEFAGAEVGAHLHHWSTPPLGNQAAGSPLRTHLMPQDILEQKLANLLNAGQKFLGRPLTSFRMGRWDLKSSLLSMLARHGILVDSSVCPLRHFGQGPDHFLAPYEPYWCTLSQGRRILEAPITQLALNNGLAKVWHKATSFRSGLCDSFHFFGCVSPNPLWHSARMMRLATRLLVKRGGRVLNMFWHSSEMMPGGSPHTPDEAAASALLEKIRSFCVWLRGNFDVEGITASQLIHAPLAFPEFALEQARDW